MGAANNARVVMVRYPDNDDLSPISSWVVMLNVLVTILNVQLMVMIHAHSIQSSESLEKQKG